MERKALTLGTEMIKSDAHYPALRNHQDYIHAATSPNTRKAYQSDIRHFMQWGGHLPASSEAILKYLCDHASSLNPRTLARRLTALKQWHCYQGFTDPTAHPAIHKTLTGIQNTHGKPKEKASPLTLSMLSQLSSQLMHSKRLIDCRNRALLLIGFFGAFRRSELVNLQWKDIRFVPEGIEIQIVRSKTDPGGEGQVCAIPKSENEILCPVRALSAWQERSGGSLGSVFRQMTVSARVLDRGIKPHQVTAIIKSLIKAGGIDSTEYSSHSLRRGFATEASRLGAPFVSIMRHGRWRHEGTVLEYIDEGNRFEQNAAGIVMGKG